MKVLLQYLFCMRNENFSPTEASYLLQGRVVRVPCDDRQPEVLGQLEEVLAGHGVAAVALAGGQVDDDGGAVGQEVGADLVQHLGGGGDRLQHVQVGQQPEGRGLGTGGQGGLAGERRKGYLFCKTTSVRPSPRPQIS